VIEKRKDYLEKGFPLPSVGSEWPGSGGRGKEPLEKKKKKATIIAYLSAPLKKIFE